NLFTAPVVADHAFAIPEPPILLRDFRTVLDVSSNPSNLLLIPERASVLSITSTGISILIVWAIYHHLLTFRCSLASFSSSSCTSKEANKKALTPEGRAITLSGVSPFLWNIMCSIHDFPPSLISFLLYQ